MKFYLAIITAVLMLVGCSRNKQKNGEAAAPAKDPVQRAEQKAVVEQRVQEITTAEDWREERNELLASLELDKLSSPQLEKITSELQAILKNRLQPIISAFALKKISLPNPDNADEVMKFFSNDDSQDIDAFFLLFRKQIEDELDCKSPQEIMRSLEDKYPLLKLADPKKNIQGEMVTFVKLSGARTVSGRFNGLTTQGARFGATVCPVEDMPPEISARIYPDMREKFFQVKATEQINEQFKNVNWAIHKKLSDAMQANGFLPNPSAEINDIDLGTPDGWSSKRKILNDVHQKFVGREMSENDYVKTTLLPAIGEEWIPTDVIDKIKRLRDTIK